MDNHHTPSKEPKSNGKGTTSQSYLRRTPESSHRGTPSSDLTVLRENQYLKNQIRQLQAKNRSLSSQIQQLMYEKSYSENKYIQKINLEQENLAQYHKEKNYQMELLQIKFEEDIGRIKRQHEIKVEEFLREIKHKDYQLKEKDQQIRYFDLRNNQMKNDFQILNAELQTVREEFSISSDSLTKADYQIKKLNMIIDEIEGQKNEMESEIRVLLDIETQKTRTINDLQISLRHSQQNQRRLTEKLAVLNENFSQLEGHIALMKQKLLAVETDNNSLLHQLDSAELSLRDKERMILDQNDRENQLRKQLEEHQIRERKREAEVNELMAENERLYHQLSVNKHQLHEIGINYGIQI